MRIRGLLALSTLLLTGCFGIELDVDSQGRLLVTREEGFLTIDPVKKEVTRVKKADAGTEPVYSRFSPNGKEILTVVKSDFQTFTFATVDVATGKTTPRAAIIGKREYAFDVSPDGKRAVVTLLEVGKVGAKLAKTDETVESLYEVNLTTGESQKLELAPPKYAFYSPNGKSLLLALPSKNFSFDTVSLEVADADDVSERQKVAEASFPLALGGEGIVYSGWVNNDQVNYFAQRKVYGIAGKNMQLMLCKVDGQKRQLLQPLIDEAAFE